MYRTASVDRGPAPVFGPADEPVPDGVFGDRGHGRLVLVGVFDHLGPVAAAEEMVDAVVAAVEGAGVAPVQVPHAFVEVRLGRLDDEVKVVRDQAAGVHPPAVALFNPVEDADEGATIVVVEDDRAVVVAARDDVVHGATLEVPVGTAHAATVALPVRRRRPGYAFDTTSARSRHVPDTATCPTKA
jgi:hypothetical protein